MVGIRKQDFILACCRYFIIDILLDLKSFISLQGLCLVFDILQVTATKRKSIVQITKTGNVAEEDHVSKAV